MASPLHLTPGANVPDWCGRTGLDQVGRDLERNPNVVVRDVEVTSHGWHVLRRTTFDYRHSDGRWETQQRETYDRGNGATILLYDLERKTVLLTRQFRFPAYVNDHPDGMLIETAAGLLDYDDPETAIRRETAEELGVRVGELQHVFDVYMSPGSVTERVHFYAAPYTPAEPHWRRRRRRRRRRGHRDPRAAVRRDARDDERRPDRRREDDHAAPVGRTERPVPCFGGLTKPPPARR